MALIGKIREKSVLLVVIIGIALLAFILGSYDKMGGGNEDKYGYGTVYGEKIEPTLFQQEADKFKQNDAMNAQQQGQPYTQKEQDASEDKAWNFIVENTILQKEYDALGIDVNETEFDAFLYGKDGFSVMPDLLQNFGDGTGRLDEKKLQSTINQLQNSSKPEDKKRWEDSKKYYIDRRKNEKYFAVLKQGVYVTKLEAEEEYKAQKETKNISYVLNRYSDIPDDKIKVSDEDMLAYFDEHKHEKKFQNPSSSRIIKYFDLNVTPSDKDIKTFNADIDSLKVNFAKSTNDSLFVLKNSEIKFYSKDKKYKFGSETDPKVKNTGLTYPASMDSVIKSAAIGQVVGPYEEKGATRLVKVVAINDKSVKVRHLLVKANGTDKKAFDAAQKKADSLMKSINKANFGEFITKFSDDNLAGNPTGVYDSIMEGDQHLVPEFVDFAVKNPLGKIGTVKTQYGIHIMEVMEIRPARYPVLAIVQKTLEASQETIDEADSKIYNILYKLDSKLAKTEDGVKKVELFDTIAAKADYVVRTVNIEDNKPVFYGFNTKMAEDKLLKLAYDDEAKVGDLSTSPIKDKNRYIIAIVSAIKTKGEAEFNDVKEMVKAEVIKEKKAKRFTAQMVGKSLDQIAKANGSKVMKADVTFASPQIAGAGYEAEVVGTLFSKMKDGQKTIPLKGEAGVYVIRINKTTKAQATANYNEEKDNLLMSNRGAVMNMARQALTKKADVIDNRRFINAGIRRN